MHRFDAGIAFDGDDTRGLALRDDAVLIVDAAEECGIERLEAVLILTGDGGRGLVALARAGERGVEVGKQQQGEVGIEAAELAMQREHTRGAELAPAALIGLGRIGVAVAQHDGAAVERGTDDLRDGLGAVGEHQAQLRARIE